MVRDFPSTASQVYLSSFCSAVILIAGHGKRGIKHSSDYGKTRTRPERVEIVVHGFNPQPVQIKGDFSPNQKAGNWGKTLSTIMGKQASPTPSVRFKDSELWFMRLGFRGYILGLYRGYREYIRVILG